MNSEAALTKSSNQPLSSWQVVTANTWVFVVVIIAIDSDLIYAVSISQLSFERD